jgi:hypothetical protein
MLARRELAPILDDEALTRHLGDAEARVLVEWLVEQAEDSACSLPTEQARSELGKLCPLGRLMARFVWLWCVQRSPGAALQLAAAERVNWPLPDGPVVAWELMQNLVDWEDFQRRQAE